MEKLSLFVPRAMKPITASWSRESDSLRLSCGLAYARGRVVFTVRPNKHGHECDHRFSSGCDLTCANPIAQQSACANGDVVASSEKACRVEATMRERCQAYMSRKLVSARAQQYSSSPRAQQWTKQFETYISCTVQHSNAATGVNGEEAIVAHCKTEGSRRVVRVQTHHSPQAQTVPAATRVHARP